MSPLPVAPPPLPGPTVAWEPAPRRVGQLRLALAAGGVLVIAVGAFVAYRKFFAAPPPPPPKPAVTARPVAPPIKVEPPAPSPVAQKAPAAPATARTPAKSAAAPVANPPGPAAPAVAEVKPPPPGPPAEVQPSMQFRAFVDRLKIGGFRIGPPARVFIRGITYKEGDVIDQDLGVVFVGVDPKTEALLFKDGSGAVFRRQL